MFKRSFSLVLCFVLMLAVLPAMPVVTTSAASDNLVTMPDNNGLTNNTSYILGEGTDAEVEVVCDFRAAGTEPTASITPKYVTIHNTGTYVSTANAYNTHRNTNKTSSGMAWHYTVDNVAIYQGLQDNRKGWHIGSVAKNPNPTNTNSNSIGIEMCVHNFPATETFDGEQWTNGTAILNWWESQFDRTMKNTAYLTLVLCKRWGLDWRTDVKMHYDALNYYPGGKDCPMQMRATYDPATNTFKEAGSYVDGRDGYFWQMFWSYLEAYASGSTTASGSSATTASKLGTYRVNATAGLNVRAGVGTSYEKVGALEYQEVVKVIELDGSWGKVVMADGTEGWCNITTYGDYIGIDTLSYATGVNSDGLLYGHDENGSMVITNTANSQGQFDLYTPFDVGTATTPFMSLQVTPLSGGGFYFGATQYGSGYFIMHNSTLSEPFTEAFVSVYSTKTEKLEIDLREYWQPTESYRINQIRFYLAPLSSIRVDYCYLATTAGTVADTSFNLSYGTASSDQDPFVSPIYDIDDTYITKVPAGATATVCVNNLAVPSAVAVYDANFRVADSALVATGMTVRQYSGSTVVASRIIVVAGDVNSDGNANTVDARIILKSTVGAALDTPLTDAQQLAADFDMNGEYATTDVRELLRSIVL